MTETVRYYYRCLDCLAGSVTSEAVRDATCGLCEGRVRLLGPVDGIEAHWVRVLTLSPCDHKCTRARGRRCECECLGRAHGSGLETVVARADGAVRIDPTFDSKGATERAGEYRQAWQQVEEALTARYGRCWPSHSRALLAEVEELATQQGRLRKLAHLLRQVQRE
jgi:hypothetical protein